MSAGSHSHCLIVGYIQPITPKISVVFKGWDHNLWTTFKWPWEFSPNS